MSYTAVYIYFRLFASLANDSINHFIETDLTEHNVGFNHCPKYQGHKSPNSYIILNGNTGSRTILHTNLGLPELKIEDFKNSFDNIINEFGWIHFEGRPNLDQILIMIMEILKYHPNRPKISFEMEKLGRNYDYILPFVDVMFISKEYAQSLGFENKLQTVSEFHLKKHINVHEGKLIICAWGDQGAAGRDENGQIFEFPAFQPKNGVIDTIGAGDTFNASVIASLNLNQNLKKALENGCRVAGTKVGQFGFKNLKNVFYNKL